MHHQLPARVPEPVHMRQHVPVDLATLSRVHASLSGWTPGAFSGTSILDAEVLRSLAAEAALHNEGRDA